MKLNGQEGIWLPIESGRRLLKLDIDYKYLSEQHATLSQLCQKKDEAFKLSQSLVQSAQGIAEGYKVQLSAEQKARQAAEKRLTAWYRHPILWYAVGVASTVGVVLAIKH